MPTPSTPDLSPSSGAIVRQTAIPRKPVGRETLSPQGLAVRNPLSHDTHQIAHRVRPEIAKMHEYSRSSESVRKRAGCTRLAVVDCSLEALYARCEALAERVEAIERIAGLRRAA